MFGKNEHFQNERVLNPLRAVVEKSSLAARPVGGVSTSRDIIQNTDIREYSHIGGGAAAATVGGGLIVNARYEISWCTRRAAVSC